MALDRLTQRARVVIVSVLNKNNKKATSGDIFKALQETSGLSGVTLKSLAPLRISRQKEISVEKLVKEAYYQSTILGHPYVGTEHLLLALLRLLKSKEFDRVQRYLFENNMFPKAMKLASSKKESVVLETFGTNLSRDFNTLYHEPLVHRSDLDHLISILLKKDNPNPLIVGEPGVGKNTLIKLLVRAINSLDVPPVLAGYQVIEFDLMAFITSVANKGNIEVSLMALQEELKNQNRLILSIKNFQNMFISTQIGVGIPLLYSVFKELLEASNVSFIATMNEAVYEKVNLDNDHLFENFTILDIEEPTEEETKIILRQKATVLGEFHNISISDSIIDTIYTLAKDEVGFPLFPERGIELLDIACSHLIVKKSKVPVEYKDLVNKTVKLFDSIDKTLASGEYDKAIKLREKAKDIEVSLTSLEDDMIYSKPVKLSKKEVKEALKDLEYIKKDATEKVDTVSLSKLAAKIKEKLIGQDEAVDTVVKALIRSKMGLHPSKRPIGSFLFLGPTGVGKTELAKVIGAETNLIRLDMSDFGEKHNVSRLVGAPPGYIGYGEGGELTQKIEAHPDSVVLFDEIEKAHPDVLNILLQITEEGELIDAKGTTFDFSKAIIILTSNLGTEILHGSEIGFTEDIKLGDDKKVAAHLKQNLKKILKPELLNRFDEVIVFKRLSKESQMQILEVKLNEIMSTLKGQKVYITLPKGVKNHLLDVGYSTEYGARSLRRIIEKELLDEIAKVLLKKKSRPIHLKVHLSKDAKSIVVKLK